MKNVIEDGKSYVVIEESLYFKLIKLLDEKESDDIDDFRSLGDR